MTSGSAYFKLWLWSKRSGPRSMYDFHSSKHKPRLKIRKRNQGPQKPYRSTRIYSQRRSGRGYVTKKATELLDAMVKGDNPSSTEKLSDGKWVASYVGCIWTYHSLTGHWGNQTDHRAMDGHDPKCATFRALPVWEISLFIFIAGNVRWHAINKSLILLWIVKFLNPICFNCSRRVVLIFFLRSLRSWILLFSSKIWYAVRIRLILAFVVRTRNSGCRESM